VRAHVCGSLAFLGVAIDAALNTTCAGETTISTAESRVQVLVIPAQENWMVARECIRVAATRS
jgi:acetate kinase